MMDKLDRPFKPTKTGKTRRSDTGTQFRPGQSGNPGGRPKIAADVIALARTYTTEAIETIASIMMDPDKHPQARVNAATALLDRGYGKPQQTMEVNSNANITLEHLDDGELIKRAKGLFAGAASPDTQREIPPVQDAGGAPDAIQQK